MTGRAYATDGRPGFMGHGRGIIASKSFASAEGGTQHIVPMPKELKDSTGTPTRKSSASAVLFLLIYPCDFRVAKYRYVFIPSRKSDKTNHYPAGQTNKRQFLLHTKMEKEESRIRKLMQILVIY